jgi:DamX protein
MDTETMTALDDEVDHDIDTRLISVAPFSPPSLSTSQYKQLELLQHLSLYSELLILFSGEKGMGKTFIAQALIASREDPDQSLMVAADFSLSYLDVLQQVAQYIDLAELDDVAALEQHIVEYCAQLVKDEQGSFLLVIDQADQLTNQALMHLNQLALIQPNALHVMLLSTPILEEVLLELPEPHAPLHIMQVDSLTEDESEIVLLEQFPEQEWSGERVDYMLQQSDGNPGKLMYIAQRLAEGGAEDNSKEKTKFPITHIAAILLVASILVVSFLYINNQPASQKIEALVLTSPVATETEEAVRATISKPADDIAEEEIDFNFIEPTAVTVASDNIVDSAITPKIVSSPVIKKPVTELEAKRVETEKATPAENSLAEKLLAEEKVTIKDVKSVKVGGVKGDDDFSDAEQVLLAATASKFVAQLFGSHSEKSAQTFMQENKSNAGQLLSYRTEHKGKSWFVVVSGPFQSRESAKKAVTRLPAALRKQQPWVRSIAPIQTLLNAR